MWKGFAIMILCNLLSQISERGFLAHSKYFYSFLRHIFCQYSRTLVSSNTTVDNNLLLSITHTKHCWSIHFKLQNSKFEKTVFKTWQWLKQEATSLFLSISKTRKKPDKYRAIWMVRLWNHELEDLLWIIQSFEYFVMSSDTLIRYFVMSSDIWIRYFVMSSGTLIISFVLSSNTLIIYFKYVTFSDGVVWFVSGLLSSSTFGLAACFGDFLMCLRATGNKIQCNNLAKKKYSQVMHGSLTKMCPFSDKRN